MDRNAVLKALVLIYHILSSNGFIPSQTTSSLTKKNIEKTSTNKVVQLQAAPSDDFSSHPIGSRSKPVFVLSFDGVVANTAHTRASLAIDAALETWPFLKTSGILVDKTWLINKIQALLHVTFGSNEGLMGCEAVILARMLLEEQELDGGKSVGKSGKYSSKFHPSTLDPDLSKPAKNGSRPLTVGEIAANWVDGANLAETLFVKYNIERKSPLPFIRENLSRLYESLAESSPPPLIPEIAEALEKFESSVYILVAHPSQTKMVMSSLSSLSVSVELANDETNHQCAESSAGIVVIAPKNEFESQDDIIRRLVGNAEKGTSFMVIQSFLKPLVYAKRLFGDNSPKFINGFGDIVEGDNIKMSLLLSSWAENTNHQQHNAALMDPWLDIVSKEVFLDVLMDKHPSST